MIRPVLILIATAGLLGPAVAESYSSKSGVSARSHNASVSAAGTTLATATALLADDSVIANCGSGAGVILSGQAGQTQNVWNAGANACNVYPPSAAHAINGGTAGAPVSLPTGYGRAAFTCLSATLCVQAP